MDKKIFNLSNQEYFVLDLLNKGLSSKVIAKKLEISPYTVNGYLKSIYFKLNVNSRGEAQNRFNQYLAKIASNELLSQTKDKAERASELAIANIELLFQTEEKSKRAGELVIANEYEPALRSALLLMLKRALIQLRDRAQDDEKKGTKRIALHQTAVKNTITPEELEYLFPEIPC